MLVSTQKPGPDGFPVAVVELWNDSSDEVLLEYASSSVVLHCGPYEQHGPADLFGRRREVLDPQQGLNFVMPSGHWLRTPTAGPRELLLPTELAKGKYPMWATFQMSGAGAQGQRVESDHDTYEAP